MSNLGGTLTFIDIPTALLFYCLIILLFYYSIVLLFYYFIIQSLFQQKTIITLLLYNNLSILAEDSRLREGGAIIRL